MTTRKTSSALGKTEAKKVEIDSYSTARFMYMGGQIDTARSKKRMSVKKLAESASVKESVLQMFLDGDKCDITFLEVMRLIEVLHLKVEIFRDI